MTVQCTSVPTYCTRVVTRLFALCILQYVYIAPEHALSKQLNTQPKTNYLQHPCHASCCTVNVIGSLHHLANTKKQHGNLRRLRSPTAPTFKVCYISNYTVCCEQSSSVRKAALLCVLLFHFLCAPPQQRYHILFVSWHLRRAHQVRLTASRCCSAG